MGLHHGAHMVFPGFWFAWGALVIVQLLRLLSSVTSKCEEVIFRAWRCRGQVQFSVEEGMSHLRFTSFATANPTGVSLLGVCINTSFVISMGVKLLAYAPAIYSTLVILARAKSN